jgi:hypothetical protein
MQTTDAPDGEDVQGLEARVTFSHWVSEFARMDRSELLHLRIPWSIPSPFSAVFRFIGAQENSV